MYKSFFLLFLLILGCGSTNGRKLSKEEIERIGLWEHANPIVCNDQAEQKNRVCHRFECHKLPNTELECYEFSITADYWKSSEENFVEELDKKFLDLNSEPCLYVQKYVSDKACTSLIKKNGKSTTVACIGTSYLRAPIMLRGLCEEKTCSSMSPSCTTKGKNNIITWLAKDKK